MGELIVPLSTGENDRPDTVPLAPVEAVIIQWQRFQRASTPLAQADALVALSNAMDDVRSWTVFRDYRP